MSSDSLSKALMAYQHEHVLIEWPGLKLRGYVLDLVPGYDMEQNYGGWIIEVDELVFNIADRKVSGVMPAQGAPVLVSLDDPPLTVRTLDGVPIWTSDAYHALRR